MSPEQELMNAIDGLKHSVRHLKDRVQARALHKRITDLELVVAHLVDVVVKIALDGRQDES